MPSFKDRLHTLLRASERYTKTDMVYLAESGFWINLGVVTVSLFSLGLYVLFARVLSPETYGTYQYLLSAGALVGALTLTGMNTAVVRSVAQGKDGGVGAALSCQLRWSIIPFLVSACVALYYLLRGNEGFALAFLLIGLLVPTNNALNTYSAYLTGKKDFKRVFTYNFSTNLLFYGALALAAVAAPAAVALLAVGLIAQGTGYFFAYRSSIKAYPPKGETDPGMLGYGKHLSVMGVLGAVAIQADSLIIFHLLGPAALAIFAFATAIPDRASGLFKFIPSSLLPVLANKDAEAARVAVSPARTLWVLLLIALAIGIYWFASPFIFALLFPSYLSAVPYSQAYALSMVGVLGSIFATALISNRELRSLYIVNTALPILQVLLILGGTLIFGLWGAVGAKVCAALLTVLLTGFLVLITPRAFVR